MSNQNRNSLEDEFRASKVYKKLSETGETVADKLADGIGKATKAVDDVMGSVDGVLNPGKKAAGDRQYPPNTNQPPQQPPINQGRTYGPQQNAPGQNQPNAPKSGYQPPQGSTYHYSYRQPPVRTQTQNKVPPIPPVQNPVQPKVAHPNNVEVKMVRQPNAAKYYVTGIIALIYAGLFPMYEYWHLAIFAVVMAGTFLLSRNIFKGKKKYVAVPIEEATEAEPEKTGNEDVDKAIQEGYDYLRRLRKANDAIKDEKMSECISRIEKSSAGIFSYISEHPEKVSQIRKFMNYYLPTTMKLLDSYQRLDAQSVKGENIQTTLTDIDRILYTVAGAFEKQLDSLFSEEAMDISTDISVFETMLKQEGFVSDSAEPSNRTSEK